MIFNLIFTFLIGYSPATETYICGWSDEVYSCDLITEKSTHKEEILEIEEIDRVLDLPEAQKTFTTSTDFEFYF